MERNVNRLHSYPKVWNLGHAAIKDLFDGPVVIQEKIDGSQFTFGVLDGELRVRSKGKEIHLPTTDKLFKGACETAEALFNEGKLIEGETYRAEVIRAPKHNTLEYARVPQGNIILFDVDVGLEDRIANPERLAEVAGSLGLEVVPTLYVGVISDLEELKQYLATDSILGKVKVEGIVIKNYSAWGRDAKMLMGKLVSEEFREKHGKDWKNKEGKKDAFQSLFKKYRSEVRWEKAIQHRRDAGELENSPRDIGPLLVMIQEDVKEECREEIMEDLFKIFWHPLKRGMIREFPEWYKERLAERQIEA